MVIARVYSCGVFIKACGEKGVGGIAGVRLLVRYGNLLIKRLSADSGLKVAARGQ